MKKLNVSFKNLELGCFNLKRRYFSFLIILNFAFLILNSQATNRILFIFDDSYSMYAGWNNPTPKIEIAQRIMGKFLDSLKNLPNLELALRCYGHTTDFKEKNCKDSKLEVPFANTKTNSTLIKQRIQKLTPLGTTPIAYSLAECVTDFTPCSNCRNIVILITDGIEECSGNPCEVSVALQKKEFLSVRLLSELV